MPEARQNTSFTTTRWSLVLLAGDVDNSQSADALAKLCEAYWYPLYAFVRRQGYKAEDAADSAPYRILVHPSYHRRDEAVELDNSQLASIPAARTDLPELQLIEPSDAARLPAATDDRVAAAASPYDLSGNTYQNRASCSAWCEQATERHGT